MSRNEFLRTDSRASTAPIGGRKLGDKEQKPTRLTMTDILKRFQSSRKNHRINGSAGDLLATLAQVVDLVPDLSFEERRAFIITEFHNQTPELSYRLLKLFGVREKPMSTFFQVVNNQEKAELFSRARELLTVQEEPRQFLHTSGE